MVHVLGSLVVLWALLAGGAGAGSTGWFRWTSMLGARALALGRLAAGQ